MSRRTSCLESFDLSCQLTQFVNKINKQEFEMKITCNCNNIYALYY